jgi:hypothetical protein
VLLLAVLLAVATVCAVKWGTYLRHQVIIASAFPDGPDTFLPERQSPYTRDEPPPGARAPSRPYFNPAGLRVPREWIMGGGPPKDGIPALFTDLRERPGEATWLELDDRVIGVEISGEAVAYPLRILNYHEVFNDTVGGTPVAVTYCPLCDSVSVLDRRQGDDVREFGVSGLLHNSNVLIYDRQEVASAESLWSQVRMEAIQGLEAGEALQTLPFSLMRWDDWSATHPSGEVVSADTGWSRDYGRNPYGGYLEDPNRLIFRVQHTDATLATKERVLGLFTRDEQMAVTLGELPTGEHALPINGQEVVVSWHPGRERLEILDQPEGVETVHTFWFAWVAMHPETKIWGR